MIEGIISEITGLGLGLGLGMQSKKNSKNNFAVLSNDNNDNNDNNSSRQGFVTASTIDENAKYIKQNDVETYLNYHRDKLLMSNP